MLMKTHGKRIGVVLLLMVGSLTMVAQQDRIEVPGDHFSLEGALELFKKSASPEEFERLLNSADSEVNNLDLNGDGEIDYIRVIDRKEGNIHAFILQAVVSDQERQDVAVIELEKLANGKAILQITGDEDIYGIETIIEPTEEVRINAGTSTTRNIVNVWSWPSVQYVYSPYYIDWISPWSWSYRPFWWQPWRPVAYYYYYPRWEPYRPYYSVCYTHRVNAYHYYRPYRSSSVIVYNRHATQINTYRNSRSSDVYRGRDHSERQYAGTRNVQDRQRLGNTLPDNSRSDRNRQDPFQQEVRKRAVETQAESTRNRSIDNTQSAGWQRTTERSQRQEQLKRFAPATDPEFRRRESTTFSNRAPEENRTRSEGQQHSNSVTRQNTERKWNSPAPSGSGQRERSSFDRGAQQRITPAERSRSVGSPQAKPGTHSGSRKRQ